MRVMAAETYGGPEVIRPAEWPVPEPGPGEVLVRVEAAGVNPADAICRAGAAAGWYDDGPYVWGWDVSGVVAGVGPGVVRWAEGDAVFGMPRFPQQARAYAEYLVAPEDEIAARPAALDAVTAAGLPLVGLTALQVIDRVDVRPGQRVLVNGAAGGVGRLAAQLAGERGGRVTAVARAAQEATLRALGVDDVVDHTAVDVSATVRDMDAVVDCFGNDALLACVRPRGVFVPIPSAANGPGALEERAAGTVRVLRHVVAPDGPGLGRLAALADTARLWVAAPEVRPLAEARAVHEDLDAGRLRGKVVLATGEA